MPVLVDGIYFKELFCKNDDCREHVGYEKVKEGALAFKCRKCKKISVFRINYSKGQENIDMIIDVVKEQQKGGEIENGGRN